MMKKYFIVLLSIISVSIIWAAESNDIKNETDLSFMIASNIQMQFEIEHRIRFPFLLGTSFLTEDNNITAKFGLELTPMTFNFLASAVWMPLPLLNISLGSEIGSGWNFDPGGFPMKGMGLYQRDDNKAPSEWALGNGLDGIVWKTHGGTTLLFDLAVFVPGNWNHLIFKIDNSLQYQNYTGANGTEAWYFKGDIYQNWLSYYFSGFIGYQMPVFLHMTGFMFEMDKPFYNPQNVTALNYETKMLCTFLFDYKIGNYISILALIEISNHLTHPVTSDFNREWEFSCVRLITTWHIKH